MTSHLPIECTDPDDRIDGWQVGYQIVKAKPEIVKAKEPSYKGYHEYMGDASTRKDEGSISSSNIATSPAKIRIRPLPHHPDFQPFPYREVKPSMKIEV